VRRRHVLCIATSDYDSPAYQPLNVGSEVSVVRDWLLGPDGQWSGFAEVQLPLNPSLYEVQQALRDEDGGSRFRDGDAVFVYVTGHGFPGEGGHRLALANTQPDESGTAFRTVELLSALKDGGVEHAVVIIDTCHSGQTLTDLGYYSDLPPSWLVLFTSGKDATAGVGVFARALEAFLGQQKAAYSGPLGLADGPYLLSLDFITSLNDAMVASNQRLRTDGQLPVSAVRHPCLPNPGYDAARAATGTLGGERREFALRKVDLEAHWLPSARGAGADLQGDFFTGRATLMKELLSFVRGRPGILVLTGRAGCGKSAALSRLVTFADPTLAELHKDLVVALPIDVRPRPGDCDVAVVAKGRSVSQTLGQLVTGLGSSAAPTAEGLRESLSEFATRRGRPATLVVDGVDESLEVRALIGALADLREIESHVRLLVGVRGQAEDSGSGVGAPTLLTSGWSQAVVIAGDCEPYWQPADLEDYAARLLRSAPTSPYADGGDTLLVARELGTQAERSFLLVHLAARALATEETTRTSDDPALTNLLGEGLIGLLRDDLNRSIPDAADRQAARDLLVASAFAQGRGTPWRSIWPRLATAVSAAGPQARTYGDTEAAALLGGRLSGYLVRDEEGGESLFRPFHDALAASLRVNPFSPDGSSPEDDDPPSPDAVAATHRRIVMALRPLVDVGLAENASDVVPPYVRRHLADHALHGGVLDDMLGDAALLSILPPGTAGRFAAAPRVDPRTSAVLHRIADAPAPMSSRRRAAEVELWSRAAGAFDLADRVARLAAKHAWRAVWADLASNLPSRLLLRGNGRHLAFLTSWQDPLSGDDLALVGRGHEVMLLSVSTADVLAHRDLGNAPASVAVEPGIGLVVVGTWSGRVVVLDTGTMHPHQEWVAHEGEIFAVAVGVDPDDRRVVLTSAQLPRQSLSADEDRRLGEVACWQYDGDRWVEAWRRVVFGTGTYSLHVVDGLAVAAGDCMREGGAPWDLVRVFRLRDGAPAGVTTHGSRGIDRAVPVPGHPGWLVVRRSRQGLFLVDVGHLEREPRYLPGDNWNEDGLTVLPTMTGHDGPYFVAASGDGLRLAPMRESDEGLRFTGETATVSLPPLTRCTAAGPPHRPTLLIGDAGGTVRRLDAQILLESAVLGAEEPKADEESRGIRILAGGPESDSVVGLGRDHRVELRELKRGNVLARTQGRFNALALASTVSASPRVVVAGANSVLYLLDPANGLEVETSIAMPERFSVSCLLSFLHGGRALLGVGSDDGRVAVLDLERGKLVAAPTTVNGREKIVMALIHHHKTLLAGCGDETVRVLNVDEMVAGGENATMSGSTLLRHRDYVRALAVTELMTGEHVVSAGDDGNLYVTALASRTTYEVPKAHGGAVLTALATVDPGVVASGGADGVVRLWRVGPDVARPLATIPLDTPINRMCFADRTLVVATSDGLIGLRFEQDLLQSG
jgi:WD40 repeat protein